MSTPYIGEIRIVGFTFAPPGWLQCDGSLQSIQNNETLYSLIGTTYGGDGQNSFALPDLRGRVPVHQGMGSGLGAYVMGQAGGAVSVTLNSNTLPAHTHPLNCSTGASDSAAPAGEYFATSPINVYASAPASLVAMGSVVGSSGGSQPHANLQPYLGLMYIIATEGIYPSQS